MDQAVLVNDEIQAGAELARRFSAVKPVKVAFWVKPSERLGYSLYLASDEIDDTNFGQAYEEVVRLVNQIGSPYLDLSRIKVLSADAPLAQAVHEINEQYPNRIPTRYGGRMLADLSVDGFYVYPSPLPTGAS